MIAYKTFTVCPPVQLIIGIPLSYPWQELQGVTEEQVSLLISEGFTVVTEEEYQVYLTSVQSEYDTWAAGYAAAKTVNYVQEQILKPAIAFGQQLIQTFSAENIAMGITQRGMTAQVISATAEVISALQSGSLYDAIAKTKAIPADKKDSIFVTDERLLTFINKIEDYLGITRSTSL
jgi:hypothetical protein